MSSPPLSSPSLSSPQRVVLTGSECTGKTTLAAGLARRYQTVWVPEAARAWAEAKGDPLGYEDVEPIVRHHLTAVRGAVPEARRVLFLDTDLVSTLVYSRHYYGQCPEWVERAAREEGADLYLLHSPDVPWIPDPSRDRGHLREEMHELFRRALDELDASWVEIAGGWDERQARAERAVDTLLAVKPPDR